VAAVQHGGRTISNGRGFETRSPFQSSVAYDPQYGYRRFFT
jgi:hypothetical protein